MNRVSFLTLILVLGCLLLPQHSPAPIFGRFDDLEGLCERSSIIAVVKSEGQWPTPEHKDYLQRQKEYEDSTGKFPPIMHIDSNTGGFTKNKAKLVTLIKGQWPEGNPVVHLRSGIGWLWYYDLGLYPKGDYLLVFFENTDSHDANKFIEGSAEPEKNLYQQNELGANSQIEPSIDLTDLPKDDPVAAVKEILSRNIEVAPSERKEAAELLQGLYLDPEKNDRNVSGFLENMDPSDYVTPKIAAEPMELGAELFPAFEETKPETMIDKEMDNVNHSVSCYPSSS